MSIVASYASREQVKIALAIADTDTTHNVTLDEIRLQISQLFDSIAGQSFENQIVQERFSGSPRTNALPLGYLPSQSAAIRAGTTVVENGVTLTIDVDFGFDTIGPVLPILSNVVPRLLYRLDGAGNFGAGAIWASGFKNIVVEYTTGFQTGENEYSVPHDVNRACVDECVRAFQAKNIKDFGDGGRIGIESRTPDPGTGLNYSPDDLSLMTMRMLNSYKTLFTIL